MGFIIYYLMTAINVHIRFSEKLSFSITKRSRQLYIVFYGYLFNQQFWRDGGQNRLFGISRGTFKQK